MNVSGFVDVARLWVRQTSNVAPTRRVPVSPFLNQARLPSTNSFTASAVLPAAPSVSRTIVIGPSDVVRFIDTGRVARHRPVAFDVKELSLAKW